MKVNLGVWAVLSRLVVALLVASTLVGVALWYLPKLREKENKHREVLATEAELHRLLQVSNQLRAQIESLNQPRVVERNARVILKYARTNEYVFQFVEEPTNAPARR